MNKLFLTVILAIFYAPQVCLSSGDFKINFKSNIWHFAARGIDYYVEIEVDTDTTNFKNFRLKYPGSEIDVNLDELNIRNFSRIDKVGLYNIPGSDTFYILLVDLKTNEGGRVEDRIYFSNGTYLKRVTLIVSRDDKAVYSTKLKGEKEISGYK